MKWLYRIVIPCVGITLGIAFWKEIGSPPSVVNAKAYLEYKTDHGTFVPFQSPQVILVCYQKYVLQHLLNKYPDFKNCAFSSRFYTSPNHQIGILAECIGSPVLANRMEQLIELGAKKFVAVGTAGSLTDLTIGDYILCTKALAEDGVSQHYLPKKREKFAYPDSSLLTSWQQYSEKEKLPPFESIPSWSFPAIFRENPKDIKRVKKQGCGVVEMEAAALYAICADKNMQALSMFVVSDIITPEKWVPHLMDDAVKNRLIQLADWAFHFCEEEARINPMILSAISFSN